MLGARSHAGVMQTLGQAALRLLKHLGQRRARLLCCSQSRIRICIHAQDPQFDSRDWLLFSGGTTDTQQCQLKPDLAAVVVLCMSVPLDHVGMSAVWWV